MSEHTPDDPIDEDVRADEDVQADEYEPDESVESPETGTRYLPDGTTASTPEDERILADDDEDELG